MAYTHTWDSATFEASPPNSDPADELGLRLRNLKEAVRERGNKEHDWGDADSATDTGRHVFEQDASQANMEAITDQVDGMLAVRTDINTIFARASGSFAPMRGYVYTDTTTRDALGTASLADGIIGISNEDFSATIWDEGDGEQKTLFPHPQWGIQADGTDPDDTAFAANTRETVAGLTGAVTIPDDGRAYEIDIEVIMRYAIVNNGRAAFVLVEDIDGDGGSDVDSVLVRGKADDVGSQPLRHVDISTTGAEVRTYTVEWCADGTNTVAINPTATNNAFNHTTGDFNLISSASRINISIKPRATV